MDPRYSDLAGTVAPLAEDEPVPGAARMVPGGTGLIGMFPGVPTAPSGAALIPGMARIPDSAGMIPGAPSIPDAARMIPNAPAIPDGAGMIPDAPGIPDHPDPGAFVDEQRDRLKQLPGQWSEQGLEDETAGDEWGVGDGYADFKEEDAEPEQERPAQAASAEEATAVLRVCRNGWNTVDTRAVGGHWFSA